MNLARWAREPFSTLGSRQWPAILHVDVRFRKQPLQKHIHGFAAHTTSELVTYLVNTGFRRYSCLFCACITTLHYRNLMHRCPGCGFPRMQQNEQDSPRILAFEPVVQIPQAPARDVGPGIRHHWNRKHQLQIAAETSSAANCGRNI